IFIVTIFCVLFHAAITGHKEIYYFAHLAPWFALSVGIALNDSFRWIQSIEGKKRLKPVLNGVALIAIGAYGFLLIQQYARYYRAVNNPDLVTFNEYKSVLREIVPEGVCPVTKRSPVIWLAFEEYDQCFASIEHRMKKSLDFIGKDFAYITPNETIFATDGEEKGMHFLGELKNTAYDCNFRIFYTGTNPQYLALTPKY